MASATVVRRIERLRAEGFTNAEIGRRVRLSPTHVSRLLNPRSMETTLRASREAKRRRTGTCIDCGGVTRYDGSGVAVRCQPCRKIVERASRHWTRARVIAAIRRWAREHGEPPVSSDWNRRGSYWPAKTNVYRNSANPNAPFDYWADAVEAAGFPRPYVGRKRRKAAA